ncbi:MAG TPA: YtxH domain-containing protein [Candidatus Saccharimonadales bacterium]
MSDDRYTTGKSSNSMGLVLIAAAAGAVAGLLFAPKRGIEMREDLKVRYNGAKNKSQDAAENAREKVNQGVESVRSKAHNTADKTKDAADQTAEKVKNSTDKAADEAKTAPERAKRDRPVL